MTDKTAIDLLAPRLVADRRDFLLVYLASLAAMLALHFGALVVQQSGWSLSDNAVVVAAAGVVALVPPTIARLIRAGRRTVQIMFGVAFAPLIAALAINGLAFARALVG